MHNFICRFYLFIICVQHLFKSIQKGSSKKKIFSNTDVKTNCLYRFDRKQTDLKFNYRRQYGSFIGIIIIFSLFQFMITVKKMCLGSVPKSEMRQMFVMFLANTKCVIHFFVESQLYQNLIIIECICLIGRKTTGK